MNTRCLSTNKKQVKKKSLIPLICTVGQQDPGPRDVKLELPAPPESESFLLYFISS